MKTFNLLFLGSQSTSQHAFFLSAKMFDTWSSCCCQLISENEMPLTGKKFTFKFSHLKATIFKLLGIYVPWNGNSATNLLLGLKAQTSLLSFFNAKMFNTWSPCCCLRCNCIFQREIRLALSKLVQNGLKWNGYLALMWALSKLVKSGIKMLTEMHSAS